MPCYTPRKGYWSKDLTPNGKRIWVSNPKLAQLDPLTGQAKTLDLPCKTCVHCRTQHTRAWGIRCVHEASLYEDNSFITLTYSPERIPRYGNLLHAHMANFLKKLRNAGNWPRKWREYMYPGDEGAEVQLRRIRYYMAGEYGEKGGRPHFHACLFNLDFPDKRPTTLVRDNQYFHSEILDKLWGHGKTVIGKVSLDSASYVARYIMKKRSEPIYYEVRDDDGVVVETLKKEYSTMSKKPGIGALAFQKWRRSWYPKDHLFVNGKRVPIPKYYDRLLMNEDPALHAFIINSRKGGLRENASDLTPRRLEERAIVQEERMEFLKRIL